MEYLAHSKQGGMPSQSYRAHVCSVYEKALCYAREAERYATAADGQLRNVVAHAALYHDLGKLLEENQSVLHNEKAKQRLPINHVDAGVALLRSEGESPLSALAVYSHHKGLPDFPAERVRGAAAFRDEHEETRQCVDRQMATIQRVHDELITVNEVHSKESYDEDVSVFSRLMLSCLVDADHSDTAAHYGNYPQNEVVPLLRAQERLEHLDRQVSKLGSGDERSVLRAKMYSDCRDSQQETAFVACDSPVGSGKTTAVMAHLLRQAQRRNARRIFVVLPYTSIITQSVETYRKYLVLPGEDPEQVVAELHCRADFSEYDTRYLTALWRAPIVVTTAVSFFETLASNKPSSLRRLHELPGSVIFLDESHAALPIRLLPMAWRWMVILAKEWRCYWVLASGSLVRFWEISELMEGQETDARSVCGTIPNLVSKDLRAKLLRYEAARVRYRWDPKPKGKTDIAKWIKDFPGPRLVIVNTVRNAAIIADQLKADAEGESLPVEHLSTALTAEDRTKTVERIKQRLNDKADCDWTLVATSCVEAGMDFSFRTAFREAASLLSLLQTAGRVNRHGSFPDSELWSFRLREDEGFNVNRGLDDSAKILIRYLENREEICPELSTRSMCDELLRNDAALTTIKELHEAENAKMFETVGKKFKVIESDTVTVVVDPTLAEKICYGGGTWRELQRKSVNINRYLAQKLNLKEIKPEIYEWDRKYDSFVGYMAGIMEEEKYLNDVLFT